MRRGMHAVVPASIKRAGQPLSSVNNVAGQNGDCFLLHITDKKTNDKWLVDGGALLSIIPPTPQQRLKGPNDIKLKAANGSDIPCFGYTNRTIVIGTQSYNFDFIVADVQCRILGADFLAKNYLAPNHRDAELINLQDYSTLPAEHARGCTSIPVNFVNQIDDPYYTLLDKYPDICTPSFTLKDPQHGVRHHIPTTGNPVQSRARRLDPEKPYPTPGAFLKSCGGPCGPPLGAWMGLLGYALQTPDNFPLNLSNNLSHSRGDCLG